MRGQERVISSKPRRYLASLIQANEPLSGSANPARTSKRGLKPEGRHSRCSCSCSSSGPPSWSAASSKCPRAAWPWGRMTWTAGGEYEGHSEVLTCSVHNLHQVAVGHTPELCWPVALPAALHAAGASSSLGFCVPCVICRSVKAPHQPLLPPPAGPDQHGDQRRGSETAAETDPVRQEHQRIPELHPASPQVRTRSMTPRIGRRFLKRRR